MKLVTLTAILAGTVLLGACSEPPEAENTEKIAAAEEAMPAVDYAGILAAEDRSAEDQEKDAWRHPAEVMALMNLQPGQMVLDVGAGSGYYSEALARVLGTEGGMVHSVNNAHTAEKYPQAVEALNARAEALKTGRIFPEITEFENLTAHKPADAVFLGLMYHEFIVQGMDNAAVNTAIFNLLKPGGLYVIEIHNAIPGSGPEASTSFHRTDPGIVRTEVTAAGFELVMENTDLLGNPDDPRDIMVFDDSIRFKTDRTLFIFRKPE